MRHQINALAACLLFCYCLFSSVSTVTDTVPEKYQRINHPTPELSLVNPFPNMKGAPIKSVKFILDGGSEYHCSKEDRNADGKRCGEAIDLSPGPHIFECILCSGLKCSAFGAAWQQSARFSVAPREKIELDLTKLPKLSVGEDEKAFTRTRAPIDLSPCGRAIEAAFYVNTCTAEGIKTFGEKLDALHSVCSTTWRKDTDALLSLAIWETANLQPTRCYHSKELKKLPYFLVLYPPDGDFWPKGTLKGNMSSWEWARSFDEGTKLFDKYQGEEFRKRARAFVKTCYERQTVVDQLIAALIDPVKNLKALVSASQSAPWNVNPSNPAGHRNYAITVLAKTNSSFEKSEAVSELVAKGSASDDKIHCAYKPEVFHIMESLTSDNRLTDAKWIAVKGLVERTPTDESLYECRKAFESDSKGPISHLERLRFLAKSDCDSNRAGDVKGGTIRSLVEPDYAQTSEELKEIIRKEFPQCVPPDTTIADRWKEIEKDIPRQVAKMNGTCESKIQFEIDKASFANRDKRAFDAGSCGYATQPVADMCREPWYRNLSNKAPKVKKKVKKIICRASKAEYSQYLDFKDGILTFELGLDRSFSGGPLLEFLRIRMQENEPKLAEVKSAGGSDGEEDKEKADKEAKEQKKAETERKQKELADAKAKAEADVRAREKTIAKARAEGEAKGAAMQAATQRYQRDVTSVMARTDLSPQEKTKQIQDLGSALQKTIQETK